MAIILIANELREYDEEFMLLANYFDSMEEVMRNGHYRIYDVQGMDVPEDNTEINPVIIELEYDGRLAIVNING
tara:strand:+ start:543 stop:764 length:222 start_codon:yes stop_codon:yes gene_type:complete